MCIEYTELLKYRYPWTTEYMYWGLCDHSLSTDDYVHHSTLVVNGLVRVLGKLDDCSRKVANGRKGREL